MPLFFRKNIKIEMELGISLAAYDNLVNDLLQLAKTSPDLQELLDSPT